MENIQVENQTIITSEDIKLILDSYRIGKKPLAKLLGWGETTIIRYMEGDIPTNEYSSKLWSILEDPKYFYELLMKRRDCLTDVAFRKSKKAVISKIMSSKLFVAAYYIVNRSNADICAGYIQYILYYVQAFSFVFYDKEIFEEDCILNSDHMPYIKLYDRMKRSGIYMLDIDDDLLTQEEQKLIDTVYDVFTWYGPKALQLFRISEKSQMKIARDKFNNRIILKDSMKRYFKDICEQYHIDQLKDIAKYPEKKLIEIRNLRKTIN